MAAGPPKVGRNRGAPKFAPLLATSRDSYGGVIPRSAAQRTPHNMAQGPLRSTVEKVFLGAVVSALNLVYITIIEQLHSSLHGSWITSTTSIVGNHYPTFEAQHGLAHALARDPRARSVLL